MSAANKLRLHAYDGDVDSLGDSDGFLQLVKSATREEKGRMMVEGVRGLRVDMRGFLEEAVAGVE